VLKDRYRYFWTYDQNLKPMWEGSGRLGHFPYPYDVDGDGKDEVFIGYAMWTPDGKQLWTNDETLNDHADGVAVGNFSGDPKGETRVYAVGSDGVRHPRPEEMLKHQAWAYPEHDGGKAPARPAGLRIATINSGRTPDPWRFDAEGNILTQAEPHHCGA
jgi:hypothetical protein